MLPRHLKNRLSFRIRKRPSFLLDCRWLYKPSGRITINYALSSSFCKGVCLEYYIYHLWTVLHMPALEFMKVCSSTAGSPSSADP